MKYEDTKLKDCPCCHKLLKNKDLSFIGVMDGDGYILKMYQHSCGTSISLKITKGVDDEYKELSK